MFIIRLQFIDRNDNKSQYLSVRTCNAWW